MLWFKFIMFFVWVAAMMLAVWAVEVARMFARRMAKEAAHGTEAPLPEQPQVAVILPIKGADEDTEQNVRALLRQDYPNFRLIFAVEDEHDPVVPILKQIMQENRSGNHRQIDFVIAGIATTRGQKIHNQLAAIDHTTAEDAILVFMDADASPKPTWLRSLIKPLQEHEQVGATTGFRFYVPAAGHWPVTDCPPNNASSMASVINAAVAGLLGPGWRNIAWGGSMAIRRADFFTFGVSDAWQKALSDDYVLSYCVKTRAKRRIEFVPACIVGSTADFEWPGFWEFASRQYRITRVCAPGVWLTAVGAALLYLTAMIYTLSFWILSLIQGPPDHNLLIMFLALYIANLLRGILLLWGGMAALPRETGKLRKARFWFTWGYPFTLAVNLWALLQSAFGRSITWRGVRYTMHNRLETTVERPATSKPEMHAEAGATHRENVPV